MKHKFERTFEAWAWTRKEKVPMPKGARWSMPIYGSKQAALDDRQAEDGPDCWVLIPVRVVEMHNKPVEGSVPVAAEEV